MGKKKVSRTPVKKKEEEQEEGGGNEGTPASLPSDPPPSNTALAPSSQNIAASPGSLQSADMTNATTTSSSNSQGGTSTVVASPPSVSTKTTPTKSSTTKKVNTAAPAATTSMTSVTAQASTAPSVVAGTRAVGAVEPGARRGSSYNASGTTISAPRKLPTSYVPAAADAVSNTTNSAAQAMPRETIRTAAAPTSGGRKKQRHITATASTTTAAAASVSNDTAANDTVPPPTTDLSGESDVEDPQPRVGAFAISVPAPSYDMDDENNNHNGDDDGEWEQLPPDPQEAPPAQPPSSAAAGVLQADVALAPMAETILEGQVKDDDEISRGKRRLYMTCGLVTVLVVIMAVVIAIVVSGGGGGDDPPPTNPTASPVVQTDPPTITVQSLFNECFSDTKTLTNALVQRASLDAAFETFVEVELCPNRRIELENVNQFEPRSARTPPLLLQSNMKFRCGTNGRLNDGCILSGALGGDILVHNHPVAFDANGAYDVVLEGIIFEDAREMLLLENGGDITFRNCLFRDAGGPAPILIRDESQGLRSSDGQRVTFEGCVFEGISFGDSLGYPGISALILGTQATDQVIVRDSTFRDNAATGTNPGNLIASVGATLEVSQNCFIGALTQGASASPIVLLDASPTSSSVSLDGTPNFASGAWDCSLLSVTATTGERTCAVEADAATCQSTSQSINVPN